jgi:predicted dehydrogenase
MELNRRAFIRTAAGVTAAGTAAFPQFLLGAAGSELKPGERLNLAFVGVGGKGSSSIMALSDHDIVGLCDVDERTVAAARTSRRGAAEFDAVLARAESRGARWYRDYRVMFEELGDKLDGVVISTPDHMHFPVTMSAINLGINVYCEKPLTHTVDESRRLAEAARRKGVVSQMGNQGHSNDGVRQAKEWIAAGAIGQVREVYSWTNRPIWPQGLDKPAHDEFIPVIPEGLDWDLWQGVAPERAYDPAYLPFSWRAWWDYGCGAVGDMACHVMDAAYFSLDLGLPASISALSTPVNEQSAPNASAITYEFPARGGLVPVTYHWLDGGLLPPAPAGISRTELLGPDKSGTLFIGDDGFMITDTYTRTVRILPESRAAEVQANPPAQTIERVSGTHHDDWVRAIREGGSACSDFDYAAGLTEVGLLGNVAIRAGARIEYDARAMKVTNLPAANRFLSKEYPDEWFVG